MAENYTRRDFLKILGAYATYGLIACNKKPEETLANRLLETFPNEIPGASQVVKYKIPEAKYCLVHIRQAHGLEFLDQIPGATKSPTVDSIKAALKEPVEKVQGDIYKVLNYLMDKISLDSVYCEGVTKTTEEEWNIALELRDFIWNEGFRTMKEAQPTIVQRLKIKLSEMDPSTTERRELEEFISDLENPSFIREADEELQNLKSPKSAVYKLSADKGLYIKAAETDESYQARKNAHEQDLLKQIPQEADIDSLIEKLPEDTLLKLISDNNAAMAVTVYGGRHDWKDNIKNWNRLNPKKKFSLIVVDPSSLDDAIKVIDSFKVVN